MTVNPEPLLLLLGVVGALLALFVSAASFNVYESILWYQSPKIWVCVSVVSTRLLSHFCVYLIV